jgi:hypothetical protein
MFSVDSMFPNSGPEHGAVSKGDGSAAKDKFNTFKEVINAGAGGEKAAGAGKVSKS